MQLLSMRGDDRPSGLNSYSRCYLPPRCDYRQLDIEDQLDFANKHTGRKGDE